MPTRVKPKMAAGNIAPSRGSGNTERRLGEGLGGSAILKTLGPRRGKYARG